MKKKVFIALTAYDSRLAVLTMTSLFNNIDVLKKNNIDVTLNAQMGDCYVDQTRNHLVKTFLASDCTDMIFVDNDLAFDGDAMLKLLNLPCQVVGGAYPYRSQDKEGFPIAIKLDENKIPIGNVELGILECEHVPTGLMRIRRDTFDILKNKYPDHIDDKEELLFFRTGILFASEGDKRWWGEDVYFCEICNRAGIKVWCEPRISFIHIGQLNKTGNYDQYLRTVGIAKV